MNTLLERLTKALAILDAHDVVPSSLEVSRMTFEALKRECYYPCKSDEPNSFMGVKIIVKD